MYCFNSDQNSVDCILHAAVSSRRMSVLTGEVNIKSVTKMVLQDSSRHNKTSRENIQE